MSTQEDGPNPGSETPLEPARLKTRTRFEIRPQVFFPAAALIVLFVAFGAIFTGALVGVFGAVEGWIASRLGWLYVAAVTFFLVFVVWLAASRHGRRRLGPEGSVPDYGYFSWFSMLFSAGMGIGLLFFSVAEPINHFAVDVPPGTAAGTRAAAADAMVLTFFHWGLHAWAIYVVVGLAICYFAYRRGLPLALRSAFYPLLGDRIYGWPGDAVDTLAIVGTLFGVATSLGIGVTQINAGLTYLIDVDASVGLQLALVAAITAVATASVLLGLSRGIRRLSLFNVYLSGILVLFVLVAGPTQHILAALVQNTGLYVQRLPRMSLDTGLYDPGGWQARWTLFYWGWWISWSPFVGMFLARISRGRTIREFIAGVLVVPTVVTFLIVTVFGQSALYSELRGPGGIAEAAATDLAVALFALLEQLPLAAATSAAAVVIIATYFVTSSDSGSLVDDIHASGGSMSPHRATRLLWALLEGAVAAVLVAAGGVAGLEALQQASLATGVPLAILLLGACWALVRALRQEERELRT